MPTVYLTKESLSKFQNGEITDAYCAPRDSSVFVSLNAEDNQRLQLFKGSDGVYLLKRGWTDQDIDVFLEDF